jgi:type III secretion protein V
VIVLHLVGLLRRNAKDFVGPQEVQWMVAKMRETYPSLVDELVPKRLSLQSLTDVLRRLVEEEVSIRDMKTVLEALSEAARPDSDTLSLTEHVRVALRDRICFRLAGGKPILFVYRLSADVEDLFHACVRPGQAGPYLSMPPDSVQRVQDAFGHMFGNLPPTAQRPVVVANNSVRRFVQRLASTRVPDIAVISYQELSPLVDFQAIGVINLPG